MSGTTIKAAANRGAQFLFHLLKQYSGAAMSDLVEAGAHPAAIAQDIILAQQILNGVLEATDEETANDQKTPRSANGADTQVS